MNYWRAEEDHVKEEKSRTKENKKYEEIVLDIVRGKIYLISSKVDRPETIMRTKVRPTLCDTMMYYS